MAEIVGIRFKRAGKVYYFDPSGIDLEVNEYVVAKTSRGLEMGQVVITPKQVLASEVDKPLKRVVRKAEPEDIQHARELEDKEREALVECAQLVKKLELPMKLISADYNLDDSRLTISFIAEKRIDFRELVRELADRLKTHVELRQIGPRDAAKLIGGFGRCGRPLCCRNFLSEFTPVAIKMAKEQNLPLNPMKISGVCGRLLCCLVYENEQYCAMKEKMPREGQPVSTPMGTASVIGGNPLKETVSVELESQAITELPLSKITIDKKPSPKPKGKPMPKGKRLS
ncbi:MAG: stage 0 sporulation family protein [Dehalococcoidales bacterium]|jgi:cell fate regulator YaaT (PSP1 superfamily)|nr:stage 0 sporulation family protein [Dehalococcoidales bacterium]|tara:strand:+ start:177 stop:1031 length:855 start_codon:yes stop_codon:yes gene_type:complete